MFVSSEDIFSSTGLEVIFRVVLHLCVVRVLMEVELCCWIIDELLSYSSSVSQTVLLSHLVLVWSALLALNETKKKRSVVCAWKCSFSSTNGAFCPLSVFSHRIWECYGEDMLICLMLSQKEFLKSDRFTYLDLRCLCVMWVSNETLNALYYMDRWKKLYFFAKHCHYYIIGVIHSQITFLIRCKGVVSSF